MTGIGIDLLEIERLERALERRPRLLSLTHTRTTAGAVAVLP